MRAWGSSWGEAWGDSFGSSGAASTPAEAANSGGYDMPTGRRKSKKQLYLERVKLGIIKEEMQAFAEKDEEAANEALAGVEIAPSVAIAIEPVPVLAVAKQAPVGGNKTMEQTLQMLQSDQKWAQHNIDKLTAENNEELEEEALLLLLL